MTQHKGDTSSERLLQLGFLGTGAMGSRLAARLLKAGYPVVVYDRTREKTQPLMRLGAQVADTPQALAAQCSVVFSSLSDDHAVEDVLQGHDGKGALAGARSGTTFVEMSTILPQTSRTLAAAARARGLDLLDAAISGSTPQVEAGTITLLVGGDSAAYERTLPILSALTPHCFYMGPSGMGTTMKLVVNTLLGVSIQVLAEALALGEKAGLEKARLLDVLAQTAVISPRQKLALDNVRREDYPVTFALQLMHKDFGLIMREAESLQVPMPVTAAAEQLSSVELASEGNGDITATIHWMEELAGIEPPQEAPSC
ncbi:MAG: 2-hydroxy-3-oxopropionate reductase [Ktedonobacterales bacterium]|jgi:3-hydroxyisobutyrate dehydrogenase-like beta-hydroxyacid dehydrogenase|nr:MAG: 2-hydroxy-3-oxopropionate reductase [Ktedonobacterales bacterium]